MWVLTALMFFGAGTSKLRHSGLEWVLSDNFQLLLIRAYYHVSDGDPLTSWGLAIAKHSGLSRVMAGAAIVLETCYFVILFVPRLRPFLGVVGILFFVAIRMLMGPTFETYLVCGLLLVPWHRIEPVILRAWSRAIARHGVLHGASSQQPPVTPAAGAVR
jgi:hypothetical protein